MPIDFEAIVAPFRVAYKVQQFAIGDIFENLAEWLTKRLRETQERERATRDVKIILFYHDAVSMWLDESQHGAISRAENEPEPTFWQSVAAPFVAFYKGLLTAGPMVESEWLLPNLLGTVIHFIERVIGSMDKFKEATPDLFDLERRELFDIFGEAALFFRLINTDATVRQVKRFSAGGIELIEVLRRQFPPSPKSAETPASGTGFSMLDLTRYVVGAIVLIPLISQMLLHTARTASLTMRLTVLDKLSEIQADVFGLRRDILEFIFVNVMAIGRTAWEWLLDMEVWVLWALNFAMTFIKRYFGEIESWIKTVGTELKRFADGFVKFLRALGDYLETWMEIDLLDTLKGVLGGAIWILNKLGSDITLTLGDILDRPGHLEYLRNKILQVVIIPILAFWKRKQIRAAREALGALKKRTKLPAEAAPPDMSTIAKFPDVYEAFFGAGAPNLGGSLITLRDSIKTNANMILETGATQVLELGNTFDTAATQAARLGSRKAYDLAVSESGRLAELTFGGEELRRTMERREDALAKAFEAWLVGSGFDLVSKALPLYVQGMIEYWRAESQKPPTERPTSPHILAKRAEVTRVRVPRVVLNVNEERALDKVLASEVAALFQGAVAQVFRLGVAQHEAA
ncbi:MAG: hypothetical protein HY741_05790 [Chloroflexi bacterium]|nr:hypothetical protein [Chloroflexota bacterium]